MRDADVPVQVFVEIETIIAEHIQPGHHQQDPEEALVRGQTFQDCRRAPRRARLNTVATASEPEHAAAEH